MSEMTFINLSDSLIWVCMFIHLHTVAHTWSLTILCLGAGAG